MTGAGRDETELEELLRSVRGRGVFPPELAANRLVGFAGLTDEIEHALIDALLNEDPIVRSAATRALIYLDPDRDPRPFIERLLGRAPSGEADDVTAAEIMTFHLGGLRAIDPVVRLAPALVSSLPTTRAAAAFELGETTDPQALPHLARALRDPSPAVRKNAVLALSRFGPIAVDLLASAVDDRDAKVQLAAALALGAEGSESALHALVSSSAVGGRRVGRVAARGLARDGATARVIIRDRLRAEPDWLARLRLVRVYVRYTLRVWAEQRLLKTLSRLFGARGRASASTID